MPQHLMHKCETKEPEYVTREACQDRHRFGWVFPSLMVSILGLFGTAICYALSAASDASARTEHFEARIERDRGEVFAALSAQSQKLSDTIESSQRQINAIRADMARIETAIKDGDRAIADQLKANQEMLMKFLAEKQDRK